MTCVCIIQWTNIKQIEIMKTKEEIEEEFAIRQIDSAHQLVLSGHILDKDDLADIREARNKVKGHYNMIASALLRREIPTRIYRSELKEITIK